MDWLLEKSLKLQCEYTLGWNWGGKTEGRKVSWEAITVILRVWGCVRAGGKAVLGLNCDSAICKLYGLGKLCKLSGAQILPLYNGNNNRRQPDQLGTQASTSKG